MTTLTPRREQFKKEIQLLSRGAGNRAAWPDGKLTVYPWDSTIDDFILNAARTGKGRSLLFDVMAQICNLNGATVDDFYSDELNTVLLTSRSLSTDGKIRYESTCSNPSCGAKADESIKVPEELEPIAAKASDWLGFDRITLPDCRDIVQIRPLQIRDEKILLDRKADQKAVISDTILRVLMHIQAVGTTIDDLGKPETLEELLVWYNALSPKDCKFLDEQERVHSPHLNTAIPHKCSQCGKDFTHILTFDQDFFR